ncbi:unnamed protein product [Brassica oleracea]
MDLRFPQNAIPKSCLLTQHRIIFRNQHISIICCGLCTVSLILFLPPHLIYFSSVWTLLLSQVHRERCNQNPIIVENVNHLHLS